MIYSKETNVLLKWESIPNQPNLAWLESSLKGKICLTDIGKLRFGIK